jgi:phosphoglucosamine mutase
MRGPIATKVKPDLMLRLGLALSDHVSGERVVVGRDSRTSGEMLQRAFTAGLLAGGSDVVDIGMVPSPCVAFTTRELGAAAGAVITASHNPPPDNGIALYNKDGTEFLSKDLSALEELVLDREPKRAPWNSIGLTQHHEAIRPYLEGLKKQVKIEGGLKVVVDCANGATSQVTPVLLRELGCEVRTINSYPDGHFPGRPPEPRPQHLKNLMQIVREVNADLGIAHDGDGDRVAVIDERGNFIKCDTLIAFFAERVLESKRGGTIIASINTSIAIDEVVTRAGGKVIRTGLGMFTDAMIEHGACFAGEPWKLVFPEFWPWADGILGAAKFIEFVAREEKPVSKILAERIPDYPMCHEEFLCPDEEKQKFARSVGEYILKNMGEVKDVLDFDGFRLNRRNGSWILVRASGTEPKVRLVVEGRTVEEMERLREIGLEGVRKVLGKP